MKSKKLARPLANMRIFISFMLLTAIAASSFSRTDSKLDVAATWVAKNCPELHRIIFSNPNDPGDLASSDGPFVVVDISGEFVLETQLRLFINDNKVHAEILQATQNSLCKQLDNLRAATPELTIETAAEKINVTKRRLSEATHHSLRAHYFALSKVNVYTWPNDSIFFPGRGTTLRIVGTSEDLAVSFSEPEPLADGVAYWGTRSVSQPELVKWAHRLLEILDVDVAE